MATLIGNRLNIANALVALLQGIQNPLTGANLYSLVKLGSVLSPSAVTTGLWAEVLFSQGKSAPAGSGGNMVGWRLEDEPVFTINTGYIYEPDTTAALEAVLTAMDIVLPTLHSHYTLPQAGNPSLPVQGVYSLLENLTDRAMPVKFADGHLYYLWSTYAVPKNQYSVSLQNP